MTLISASAGASATASLLPVPESDPAVAIFAAAGLLLPHLERGERVDATTLRAAMEAAFGASDSTGAWDWKTAYDACEAATVLFLRKYGKALFRKTVTRTARLSALTKIAGLLPTHTRRSAESQTYQQFSTPIPLGLVAAHAAAITPADRVLEPSAGTGLLAILAEIAGGALVLNELAEIRAGLLDLLFPAISVTRFDAAQIDDHLDPTITPSVVLMNPPFSAMANVEGRMADTIWRHVASALARLAPGGRLVTITGASFAPDNPAWKDAFIRLQERGRVVFSAAIDGSVYAKHGTTFPTRLTVIDKRPADDPAAFPVAPGVAQDAVTLLGWLGNHLPERLVVDPSVMAPAAPIAAPRSVRGYINRAAKAVPSTAPMAEPPGLPLAYEILDGLTGEGGRLSDGIYEEYGLQAIRISGSQAHPTRLVQSAAMASVAPPRPSYRPRLPANIHELLSDAQLETVIYAGEAHSDHLAGSWTVDATFDVVSAVREDAKGAARFRRGFMIGDGTGVGKGRQSAAIILDNWLQGRRKAVWISKSDKLIEDAQRDWSALGMERLLVTPLSRFPQGFMDDAKRILIFSDAGGTGRSYHAELSARNTRLRVHYLLEPGWKADAAIQGLGRTHRTNQAQPPLFRPIATDVKAEKRFLSTIARRLDTLGAITRGQRQTGGQGLFRPEDNLESPYARDALRQLYLLLVRGKVEGCSLDRFESATGLKLMDANGIKDELPPITTFLNRLLALTIELQGVLFTAFEQLLTAKIEGAIAAGIYDVGLETLTAEGFTVTGRQTIYMHPGTGAETRLLTIAQRTRNRPVKLDDALVHLGEPGARLLVNERSGRAAVQVPETSIMLDDGEIERRVRLIRPMESHAVSVKLMGETHWAEADRGAFASAWTAEVGDVLEFSDSTIHIVAGLLLPIWKRLPNESTRVYRLQTDDGERIVGRKVSPAWAANATATDAATLAPADAFMALMDGRTILDLAEGLQLRRVRVMGANRIELSGFTDTMRERLVAYGLFHEIISWKLRMFVPTDATGPTVLERVLGHYPVQRIGEREAA